MSENMEQLLGYLERENLKVSEQHEGHVTLHFRGVHGANRVTLVIDEGTAISCFTSPGITVPEGSRADIAVAVARANYGMQFGRFELNMDEGDLVFRLALPFEGSLPSDKLLELVVYRGLWMMDVYMAAFLSVIYGNEPVRDAIELVEKK